MSKEVLTIDYTQLGLSTLEAEVLTQYQLLANQLKTLDSEITKLNYISEDNNTVVTAEELSDNLRDLEKKLGLVYTFFQGAVYQLFLQNEVADDQDQQGEEDDDTRGEDTQGRYSENDEEIVATEENT